MKKLLTVLLALLMVFAFAGCNKDNGGDEENEKLKVVFCINGTQGDKSFFDSGIEGIQWINRDFGDKVDASYLEFTYDDSTWQSQLENVFASEEYDIIIAGTYDMIGMTSELVKEYPDQKVWFFDEQWDFTATPSNNVYDMLFAQNEGSYVVGAMAAMLTKTNHITFCGGMSNTVLLDFAAGYAQGAKAINPDITVDIAWMDSFSDSTKGKDVATAAYSQGVDIVFACGGGAGLGVFDAALEYENVYVIGVDGDQGSYFLSLDDATSKAKGAKTITSMTKNVNQGFYDAMKAHLDGTLPYGTNAKLGVNGGYVGAAINDTTKALFTEEQLKQVEQIKTDIANGTIKVDTAF